MAGTVIDCTGDGDLAARAGAPFYKGREEDGQMQPMTLMFKVAGVDEKRAIFPGSFETNIPVPDGMVQDLGKANLPSPAGHVLLYQMCIRDSIYCTDRKKGIQECKKTISAGDFK